jgi:ABC-type nitrate/sulfonate/bicarbonate transport system substrate-binding protein
MRSFSLKSIMVCLGLLAVPVMAGAADRTYTIGVTNFFEIEHAAIDIAIKRGFFEKRGIKVESYPMASLDNVVALHKSGSINASIWLAPAWSATAHDASNSCLTMAMWLTDAYEGAFVGTVSRWNDITGRTVVTNQPVSLNAIAMDYMLRTRGVVPQDSEQRPGFGKERMLALLNDPQVAATIVYNPLKQYAVRVLNPDGTRKLHLLGDIGEVPDLRFPASGLVVPCRELEQGNPMREVHRKVIAGVMEGLRFLTDPRNEKYLVSWIALGIHNTHELYGTTYEGFPVDQVYADPQGHTRPYTAEDVARSIVADGKKVWTTRKPSKVETDRALKFFLKRIPSDSERKKYIDFSLVSSHPDD